MLIRLTSGISYDLAEPLRVNNLCSCINRKIRENNANTELTEILNQLNAIPQLVPKLARIKTKISAHLQTQQVANPPVVIAAAPQAKLPQWKKTGEDSFQKIYVRLLEDAKTFHGNIGFLAYYSAYVLNMFMHMATVTPVQHHAAAQEREFKRGDCLQYGRSQGKHPNADLYRKLNDYGASNRLPANAAFFKMLSDIDPKSFKRVRQFDQHTGNPVDNQKKDGYVNLIYAHAGLRVNNIELLARGLSVCDKTKPFDANMLLSKLTKTLPPKRSSFKKKANLNVLFRNLQQAFARQTIDGQMAPAGKTIMTYRLQRVNDCARKIGRLKLPHIESRLDSNSTCLYIRFYPGWNDSSPDIKEGLTNVLISLFSGILQYKIAEKKMCLRAVRRQSFGFLRPSLTDAGLLTMRLSLGLEPAAFDALVIDSLQAMNTVLTQHDFKKRDSAIIQDVFKTKNSRADAKRKQHSYLRNCVAKDRKTLDTFEQAEASIRAHGIETGVNKFLTEYVMKDTALAVDTHAEYNSGLSTTPQAIRTVLQNSLLHAKKMASSIAFNARKTALPHTFIHAYKKLLKNVMEGANLLNQAENHTADMFFYQATRCVENLIEYMLVLDVLTHPDKLAKNPNYDPVKLLKKTELDYFSKQLGLKQGTVSLFFADSGQQAINLPLMVYGHHYKQSDEDLACIHLFNKTYFEVEAFFSDIKKDNLPTLTSNTQAKIVLVDIGKIDSFNPALFPKMQVCILDITFNPDVDNAQLKRLVSRLMRLNIVTVMSSSMLKHEQLGQDKFQAGKFFVITPPQHQGKLRQAIENEFQSVSDLAMNPFLASSFNLFNTIAGVKPSETTSPLVANALFKGKAIDNKAESAQRQTRGQVF